MERRYGAAVSFTGHSLGGSLAAMASNATGRDCETFNAAGIGTGNHDLAVRAGGGVGASERQIVNYHAPGDPLTVVQEGRGAGILPAAGAQVTRGSTYNPVKGHNVPELGFATFSDRCGG